MQSDKRNTYRRKIKEEKAITTGTEADANGDNGSKDKSTTDATNGDASAHTDGEDAERPFKKFKAQNGAALAPDADGVDETEETIDDQDGDVDETMEDDADDDEQADDAEVEDEEEEEDEDADDDDRDDLAAAAGLRDEALDEPGSDSD